jgi:hypothetical protein
MVRCSRCGQLVARDQYAAHVPCQGPRTGPTASPAESVGWGSLLLPPGHVHRADSDQAPQKAAEGADRAQGYTDPALGDPAPPGAPLALHKAPRLDSARGRVLHLLLDRQWHPSHAITDPAVGGSEGLRRLRELRSAGCVIDKRRASAGVYEYRLAQHPDDLPPDP